MGKKWFRKAIEEKPPYTLGGWRKNLPVEERRKFALRSRPKNMSLKHRYLSAGRALNALANVSRDEKTRIAAKRDAKYFFERAKKRR